LAVGVKLKVCTSSMPAAAATKSFAMETFNAPPRFPAAGISAATFCFARSRVNVTVQGPPAAPVTMTLPEPIVDNASKAPSTSTPRAL